jgi:hypothetical protein
MSADDEHQHCISQNRYESFDMAIQADMSPKGSYRSGVSWWGLVAVVLILLPACFGRALQEEKSAYEIYYDGDIDPEWSDWSFGYLQKKKNAVYQGGNSTEDSRKEYCIDIPQQYGAASFATTSQILIDNTTMIDISLRRNGTREDVQEGDDLSRLQLVLEGVSKDISFMTEPISILEIIGNEPRSEEMVDKFFNGELVDIAVNAADLIAGMPDGGQVTFSQISIGSCFTQDTTCLSSKTDSIISFCIGSMSIM